MSWPTSPSRVLWNLSGKPFFSYPCQPAVIRTTMLETDSARTYFLERFLALRNGVSIKRQENTDKISMAKINKKYSSELGSLTSFIRANEKSG